MNAEQKRRLKMAVAAMPKCPTCNGFAIPSATQPNTFVCKVHGRFDKGKAGDCPTCRKAINETMHGPDGKWPVTGVAAEQKQRYLNEPHPGSGHWAPPSKRVRKPTTFTRRPHNLVSTRSTTKQTWRREGKASYEWRVGNATLDRYRVQYLAEGLHNTHACWALTLPGKRNPVDQTFKTSALAKQAAKQDHEGAIQ